MQRRSDESGGGRAVPGVPAARGVAQPTEGGPAGPPGGCGAVRSPRTQASTLTSSWELEVTYQLCSADLSPMRRNLNLLPHSAQHRQARLRPGPLRAPEAGTPRPGGAPLGGPGHGLRAESCARCIGGQGSGRGGRGSGGGQRWPLGRRTPRPAFTWTPGTQFQQLTGDGGGQGGAGQALGTRCCVDNRGAGHRGTRPGPRRAAGGSPF